MFSMEVTPYLLAPHLSVSGLPLPNIFCTPAFCFLSLTYCGRGPSYLSPVRLWKPSTPPTSKSCSVCDLLLILRRRLACIDLHSVVHAVVDMVPFAGISENATVQEYWKALKVRRRSLCNDYLCL